MDNIGDSTPIINPPAETQFDETPAGETDRWNEDVEQGRILIEPERRDDEIENENLARNQDGGMERFFIEDTDGEWDDAFDAVPPSFAETDQTSALCKFYKER